MRVTDVIRIHAVIRRHIGAANAISAPEISKELGWLKGRNEREIRRAIAEYSPNWTGILVCSIPGRGYFCAETYEEAENYNNWLSDLANEAARKRDSFRELCCRFGFNFTREKQAA